MEWFYFVVKAATSVLLLMLNIWMWYLFGWLSTIVSILGIVLLMGIAFVTTAILLKPTLSSILEGIFIPNIPKGAGAGLLILGIIGTTVVPEFPILAPLFVGIALVIAIQIKNKLNLH